MSTNTAYQDQKDQIDNVREFIGKGDIDSAIIILNELLKDDDRVKELTLQSFRKNNAEKCFNNGIIDYNTVSLQQNLVVNALLDLIQDLEKYSSVKGDAIKFANELKYAKAREFTFLLVGRTGVGKSSTINSLMGYPIAKTGKYKPTTMEVIEHRLPIEGVNFLVIDTPGLCDALPTQNNDNEYIDLILKKVKNLDCLLYVTFLDDTRVRSDEMLGIDLITKAFTSSVWNNSVIVFTRADKVEKNDFKETLNERTELIREAIQASGVSAETVKDIPSVAVDNLSQITPDGELWLGELYTTVIERVSSEGFAQILLGTMPRLVYQNTQDISSSIRTSGKSFSPTSSYNSSPSNHNINKIYIKEPNKVRLEKAAEKNGFWDKVGNGIETVATAIGKGIKQVATAIEKKIEKLGKFLFG